MRREGAIQDSDRGETLIELLVTVLILGTAVVALVGGLALAVRVSDIHRKQATAGAAVRAFAEALQTKVAANGYEECALNTSAGYNSAYTEPPPGYTARIDVVMFWNGSAFVVACSPDMGVQRVSITVASNDGRASESLDVVLRKPCRLGDSCV